MQQWHTSSIRLNTEELAALAYVCERKKVTKHEFLKSLLLEEIAPVLAGGGELTKGGVQPFGDNHFAYDVETDSFTWQIDRGVESLSVLSEHITPSFLANLGKALEGGLKARESAQKSIPKGKVSFPKELRKYEARR